MIHCSDGASLSSAVIALRAASQPRRASARGCRDCLAAVTPPLTAFADPHPCKTTDDECYAFLHYTEQSNALFGEHACTLSSSPFAANSFFFLFFSVATNCPNGKRDARMFRASYGLPVGRRRLNKRSERSQVHKGGGEACVEHVLHSNGGRELPEDNDARRAAPRERPPEGASI